MAELRDALERAVLDDPEDVSAHMAYADYLAEQGDPRGELIQVQLALEDDGHPCREELRRREAELLDAHLRGWLGELAPFLIDGVGPWSDAGLLRPEQGEPPRPRFRLRRGWLDALEVPWLNAALARALRSAPAARGLHRLQIEFAGDREFDLHDYPSDMVLGLLAGAAFFPQLRSCQFGKPEADEMDAACLPHGELYGGCSARGDYGVLSLVEEMPRLEELRLFFVQSEDVTRLYDLPTFTHLRVLQIHHLQDYNLGQLALNPSVTRLERLLLMPHAIFPGGSSYLPRDEVIALLRSPCAVHLTHLQLRLSDLGDEGVAEIISTGLLGRLEVLDLRHGVVTDTGALALARAGRGRLQRLDLQRNRLTQRGISALQALALPVLRVEHQQQPGAGGEYDDDYLYDGDWE
jgi:uncharacterized protein (TIGR02996 family)